MIIWGGANFDEELLKSALHKICVHPYEDPVRKEVFKLSALGCKPGSVPTINCFVRDRNKWLGTFRRRGATVTAVVADSSA